MDKLKQIAINSFFGDPDGAKLKGCYFVETKPHSHEFTLFQPDSTPIPITPSPVKDGTKFSFPYQGLMWSISGFLISEHVALANGTWSAVPVAADDDTQPSATGEDPETGTFQAQAGPGAGDDLEASASASA